MTLQHESKPVDKTWSDISETRSRGVHPDLMRVVRRAFELSPIEFRLQEGVRTLRKQKEYKARGASRTLRSRHLTGHAVDLVYTVDGKVLNESHWGKQYSDQISAAMKQAAEEFGVDITWGGDWQGSWDTPHYQLSWQSYPRHSTAWRNEFRTPVQRQVARTAKAARKAPISVPGGAVVSLAVVFGYVESIISWMFEVVSKFGELAPIKSALVQAGANSQAVSFAGLTFAVILVISKLFKPDEDEA